MSRQYVESSSEGTIDVKGKGSSYHYLGGLSMGQSMRHNAELDYMGPNEFEDGYGLMEYGNSFLKYA